MGVHVSGTTIQIPQGDTGVVKFVFDANEGIASQDKGVFTLVHRGGMAILRKILAPDMSDAAFPMMFVYEDTAKLKPGYYDWSFRVMRGGTFDVSGKLTSVRRQHTAILSGRLNVMPIAGGAR